MTSPAPNGAASIRIRVTTFRHARTSKPQHSHGATWSAFVQELHTAGHAELDDKFDGELFGLFALKEGTTRANKHVETVHGWALDLDKLNQDQIVQILERLSTAGLAFVAYSTHSHTSERWKLRVLGPLAEPVPGKDWPNVWRAIVDKFAPGSDEQCKDVCRIYFWPSCPPGQRDEAILLDEPGEPLDVSTLDVKPSGPARVVDLNAKELLTDGGVQVPRCPASRTTFEHAEELCRTMPPAVSGKGGHVALLRTARALRWGLELDSETTAKLLAELYNPRCDPPWTETELAHKVEAAEQEDGAAYRRGALRPAEPTDFDHLPYIVQNAGRFWLRARDSDDYARTCVRDDLQVQVQKHYSDHEMCSEPGELPKVNQILRYSQPVSKIVSCYYQSKTLYDPQTEILIQGLRIDPTLHAVHDPDVEAFLVAFAGERLDDLKQWIAGCRPDRLTAPARALAVVGAKGLGKSLFAHALARIWGQSAVPANVLCARFNGALSNCPIVLADEEMPKDLTGEDFRTVIQERSHSIEPKGKERHSLLGCIRLIVAANDSNKLHLFGTKGKDDVAAIADRFFVILVPDERVPKCLEKTERLKLDDGSTVDLQRMAQHFLYIQHNVEPARGRFIGAAEDQGALALTLAAETERTPELFDLIRDFFNAGGAWAEKYSLTQTSGVVPRRGEIAPEARANFPIIVNDGRVFVRAAVLGQLVGRELSDVLRALKPFAIGQRSQLMIAGKPIDVQELSAESLLSSLRCDVDAMVDALTTDTIDRTKTPGQDGKA